jgi:outer membrane protein TolC
MTHRVLYLFLLVAASAHAQRDGGRAGAPAPNPPDTLHLGTLQSAALAVDPRQQEVALDRARSALRLRSIAAERLPSFAIEGQAQYQSDVTSIPIRLPGGQSVPEIPHDSYDAHMSVEQRLFDPTIGPRRAAEHARLAEEEAGVRTTLYGVRREVNESFFTAALLQSRADELNAMITDLEAQLRVVQARVQEGAALAGEAATIEAELLRRRQDAEELRADRTTALTVLGDLAGRTIHDTDVLALPDLDTAVARARTAADTLHRRPEYEQFARTRERLAREADVAAARTKLRIAAFGQVGYGRPGLDFLSNRFDTYGLAGIRLQWSPFDWGTTDRDREALEVQQRVVTTEQAAFTAAIRRGTAGDLATIDRLQSVLTTDERIRALRERIEGEARARLAEGALTAADYVARRTDVLEAQLTRDAHRVQLAQASVRYLTTLGLEVR